jgi:Proline racemase
MPCWGNDQGSLSRATSSPTSNRRLSRCGHSRLSTSTYTQRKQSAPRKKHSRRRERHVRSHGCHARKRRTPSGRTLDPRKHCRYDTQFVGTIVEETIIDDGKGGFRPAIVPQIEGSAYITQYSQVVVDPKDPFPEGYRVADIW